MYFGHSSGIYLFFFLYDVYGTREEAYNQSKVDDSPSRCFQDPVETQLSKISVMQILQTSRPSICSTVKAKNVIKCKNLSLTGTWIFVKPRYAATSVRAQKAPAKEARILWAD